MFKNLMGEMGRSVGLLVLRVAGGLMMASHGAGKMKMVFAGQFDQFADPIGLGPHISLIGAALAEFVFAMLTVAGAFTRIVVLPVIFTMLVAVLGVHLDDGFGGMEKALLYLTIFGTLFFTGGGRFSVDELLERRRKTVKK